MPMRLYRVFRSLLAVPLISAVLALSAPLALAQAGLLLDTPAQPVPAPPFTASTATGGTLSLEQFKGRVVFLNFWATWCVPCLIEMPAMDRLAKALQNHPFTMLAVNFEEGPLLVEKFLRDKDFSYAIVLDPKGQVSGPYGVSNLPLTFIIGPDGRVLHRALGPREWDSPQSIAFFKQLSTGQ